MSTPTNPLANFKSYSYYHVLALCDSITTAEYISNQVDLNIWDHPATENYTELGRFSPKRTDVGQYCIIINGSTDAQYSITSFKYSTLNAVNVYAGGNSNSVALEGSLNISEPKGIMFLQRIIDCSNAMNVDAVTSVWVIKTFFVGYNTDNELETISTVVPLMFKSLDVTGSFSEQGGIYEMTFVGISHGMARLPQFSKLSNAAHYVTGQTLKDAARNLEAEINRQAEKYFECVKRTVTRVSESTADSLTRIEYKITLDESYQSDFYKVTNQLPQAKTEGKCASPATGSASSGQSIEQSIEQMMMLSTQVVDEANKGINGQRYFYKILTTVDDPTNTTTIHYTVNRTMDPMSISFEDIANDKVDERLGKNILYFDYMYTGKNVDIIEYDMKLSLGLAHLMSGTAHNSYRSQFGVPDSNINVPLFDYTQGVGNRWGQGTPAKSIPVGLGTRIKSSVISNTPNVAGNAAAQFTMKKASSFEVMDVSMTIAGNTQLLSSVNYNSIPSVVKAGRTKDTADDANHVYPDWGLVPPLAKIRIKMPRNNDDLSLFLGERSLSEIQHGTTNDYTVDFWFDGYYYVIGIEHIFADGTFTQQLEMIGIPKTNFVSQPTSQETAQALDQFNSNMNDVVDACYDNNFECKESTVNVIPEVRPLLNEVTAQMPGLIQDPLISKIVKPENAPDLMSQMKSNVVNTTDYDSITAWKNLKDTELKGTILKAAQAENLTSNQTFLMLSMMSAESKFNPKAQGTPDPTTGNRAQGLGQFFPAAWKDTGMGDKGHWASKATDPYLNTVATARLLKQSQQQLESKLNRPVTNEEIYLAHYQGVGGATSILKKLDNNQPLTSKQQAAYNYAMGALNTQQKGGVNHRPHKDPEYSPVFKSTSGNIPLDSTTQLPELPRKAKDAAAVFRNCTAEALKVQENKKMDTCGTDFTKK